MSSEVEICALSTSMRQDALGALGRVVAAMEGVEKSKRKIASNAANNAIGFLNSFEYVAMPEDDKIQGSPEKVIYTEGISGGGCPDQRTICIRQGFLANEPKADMCESAEALGAEDEGFKPSRSNPI